MLAPTPDEWLCDKRGRPHFLWDVDMTSAEFDSCIRDPDVERRAYWIGKRLRQAKPDDALNRLTLAKLTEVWPLLKGRLGKQGPFWAWWMARHGV